jgi:hypothetical protein
VDAPTRRRRRNYSGRLIRVHDMKVENEPTSVLSRNREGADICGISKLFCHEQSHGLALIFDYVLDSLPYILILP